MDYRRLETGNRNTFSCLLYAVYKNIRFNLFTADINIKPCLLCGSKLMKQ
jgi:hypothetical protein